MPKETPRPPKPGYQRFRMVVAYDGTDYLGWQRLDRTPTVQQTLEECLSTIFNEHIDVIGSGRTDAGVHAAAQQAHFDAIPDPRRIKQLRVAMRRLLPPSVILRGLWTAPPEFHAIWSVIKKTYKYRITLGPTPSVYSYRYSGWYYHSLDIEKLQAYSRILLGKHDFKSFMNSGSPVKSTVREILEADWTQVKPGQLVFSVTSNGFLKQMVRNLVGTQVALNKKGGTPEIMKEILDARDRQKALMTAPARGLSLSRVYYPRNLDIQCRKI